MVGIFIFQIGTKEKYDIYKLSPSYRRSTWCGRLVRYYWFGVWHRVNMYPLAALCEFTYEPKVFFLTRSFIKFSQNTTNSLLSIYKSGNMFWLIEPSSGQFTNHIGGTFSRCAQCGLWIGLTMAQWAETCCKIYRLIIKNLLHSDGIE